MRPWRHPRFKTAGPLDKRRTVHRCEQCRISRTKCDSERPCHACRARVTRCQDQAPQKATQLDIVLPFASASPDESRLQLCLRCAYEFFGTCPSPITDLFSTDEFVQLSREDESIRAALVQIGDVYANNNQQPILDQVALYIVHPRGSDGFSAQVDKSTFLLFRFFQGVGKLMRDECTTFADAKWCKAYKKVEEGRVPVNKEQDTWFFECTCIFVARLAHINVQSRIWLDQETKFTDVPEFLHDTMDCTCSGCTEASTYAKHLATGQDVMRQAAELLASIDRFDDLLSGSKLAHDSSYDMFHAHSLCLRIGTLRLFSYFPWQKAPFSEEALREPDIQAYARAALKHVENRLQYCGLEAVIYIQHLVVIGIEVRDLASRHLVTSLLQKIRSRGFIIAEVYIEDLQLAWEAVPGASGSAT
ncbi:hypothetical protein Forpe1208_v003424 [Fusarium oxysporum f. sp. rapae]|uniref:Zn(2)-C6 fungal-type domain-containing protein n=1 Tax=Fusarium oxysporum f. sp. rapae TaxID=485398 RepID=A0A8J5P5C8_FUSOX|nr:hypothetical protein Forpe1208_v003424 [Fusarium oxysporum f. sp. rapae]